MDETQTALNARYSYALLPLTVTYGLFATIGVIGNIVVLIVFSLGREFRNKNFKIFVVSLGIVDLLTCTFLIPAEMLKHRNYFSFENLFMCKTKCLFNVWAGCAAALILLLISVDRFRKVCQPLKRQITPILALKLCILLAFVVPVLLSWPGAMMCGIKEANKTNIYNTTTVVYLCATEPVYEKSIWRYIYKYTFVILLVGVSICCLVIYVLIGCQIKRHWSSVPANFRKDSGKDINSDYSSDTFGSIKKQSERTSSTSDGRNCVINNVSIDTLKKATVDRTESNASEKANLNGQTAKLAPKVERTNSDADKKAREKLIKQLSNVSLSSLNKIRKESISSTAARRTMSRSNSGFGMRKFPYKTLIWFTLTMIFVITYIMYLVLAIKVPKLIHMDTTSFTIFSFFYRLYFLNNIVNPVVYFILDERFRKACKTIVPLIKMRLRTCCK